MDNLKYKNKYLKYKNKYLFLKNQLGGIVIDENTKNDAIAQLNNNGFNTVEEYGHSLRLKEIDLSPEEILEKYDLTKMKEQEKAKEQEKVKV